MLLHFALVLHFAAILITFCGDYYILRRNDNNYTNSFMKLIKCLTRRFVLSFCHIVVSLPCFLLSVLLQFSSFLVSIQVIPGETSVTLKKSTLPK